MSQLSSLGGNTQIQGNLPMGGGANAGMIGAASNSPTGAALGNQYADAYNTALQQNQANYNNILQGYQQTAANQQTAQGAIGAGYGQLSGQIQDQMKRTLGNQWGAEQQINAGYSGLQGQVQGYLNPMDTALGQQQGNAQRIQQGYGQLGQDVQGTISGIGASQAQAIRDAYAQQSGQLSQGLISSGLGNTTVAGTMQRGVQFDQQKANIALANQMAQLSAGYQSQLGQAGLNYANQANMQNTAQMNQTAGQRAMYGSQLGQAQLGYMNQATQQDTAQQNAIAQQMAQIGQSGLTYQDLASQQRVGQANQQLGFMNSVSAQYPDAAQYGNLLAQSGMYDQMNQDRQQMASQYADMQRQQQMLRGQGQQGPGGVMGRGAAVPGVGTNQLSQGGLQSGPGAGGPNYGANIAPSQADLQYQYLQAQQRSQQAAGQQLGGMGYYGMPNQQGAPPYTGANPAQGGYYGTPQPPNPQGLPASDWGAWDLQ